MSARRAEGRRGVVAVIPARRGSRRLPGKNVRPLMGQPLVVWSVRAAMACALIDEVVVSTDDPEVAQAVSEFPVRVVERPAHLASDAAPIRDALRHLDGLLGGLLRGPELMVLLQPTSPLREAGLIEAAIERMRDDASADYLVEVTSQQLFTGRVAGDAWVPDFAEGTRTQDIPPVWFPTGRLYVLRCATTLAGPQQAERCLALKAPFERCTNIDYEHDFLWTQTVFARFERDYAHLCGALQPAP